MENPDMTNAERLADQAAEEHMRRSREIAAAEDAAFEAGHVQVFDPGDDDGGFGPGSYFHRAMNKDD